jgi:hypothetical protein
MLRTNQNIHMKTRNLKIFLNKIKQKIVVLYLGRGLLS